MKKLLVAYFSRRGDNYTPDGIRFLEKGNTQLAAEMIGETFGAELFEIIPVNAYPADYRQCCAQAVRESKENARPEIAAYSETVCDADAVIVGFPNWCGTMPMCVRTFLDHYDWSGKQVAALCTNEGSGFANSLKDLAVACPGAVILESLEVRGSNVLQERERILSWVSQLVEKV